jgi:hypothetical protein
VIPSDLRRFEAGHDALDLITRMQYQRSGLRYASDQADAEWALIVRKMPRRRWLGRSRRVDLREVMRAILLHSVDRPVVGLLGAITPRKRTADPNPSELNLGLHEIVRMMR